MHAARAYLSGAYDDALLNSDAIDYVDLPEEAPGHAWHLYVIRLNLERLRIDRAAVIEALKERGIGTSVHFKPLHLHPAYSADPARFPVATAEYERVISLPLWPEMQDADVERVVQALEDVLVPPLGRWRRERRHGSETTDAAWRGHAASRCREPAATAAMTAAGP